MQNRFQQIKDLVEQRDALLLEHPELIPFQEIINNALLNAGSQHNRQVVLQELMYNHIQKLRDLIRGVE